MTPPPTGPDPLLTQRSLLILLTATVVGLVLGGLTFLSKGDIAAAVLTGLAGAGTTAMALHVTIN